MLQFCLQSIEIIVNLYLMHCWDGEISHTTLLNVIVKMAIFKKKILEKINSNSNYNSQSKVFIYSPFGQLWTTEIQNALLLVN